MSFPSAHDALDPDDLANYYLNVVTAQVVTAYLEHRSSVCSAPAQGHTIQDMEVVIKTIKRALKDPTP